MCKHTLSSQEETHIHTSYVEYHSLSESVFCVLWLIVIPVRSQALTFISQTSRHTFHAQHTHSLKTNTLTFTFSSPPRTLFFKCIDMENIYLACFIYIFLLSDWMNGKDKCCFKKYKHCTENHPNLEKANMKYSSKILFLYFSHKTWALLL